VREGPGDYGGGYHPSAVGGRQSAETLIDAGFCRGGGIQAWYLCRVKSGDHSEAKKYVEAWRETGQVLDRLKWDELRKMTEADAARAFTEWDYPLPSPWKREIRPEDNGLVEQQRWFMKAHAHRTDS